MRIRNWVGRATLASAACLLATACASSDPWEMDQASEHELGAQQGFGPSGAMDLSQGASCVESVQPGALECPGLSQLEVSAIQASIQPRLMSIAPLLRVTVLRTGDSVLAQIDGGEHSRAFEDLFGTSSFLVPVDKDGTFHVTAPIAERGATAGRQLGGLGTPGFGGFGFGGQGAGIGGWQGAGGLSGGPIGGGPGGVSPYSSPFMGGQGGLYSPQMSPLSGGFGASGAGCPCPGGFEGAGGPGFSAMQPMHNAYAVEATFEGKVDLQNVQFARDEVNQTEVAILDRDSDLTMQGEIVLIPLTPGLEQGGPQAQPGGQQAFPGPQAFQFSGPQGPQQGAGIQPGQQGFQQGAPQQTGQPGLQQGVPQQGAFGPGQQASVAPGAHQGAWGGPGQQTFQGGPQAFPGGPQAGPGIEAGAVCRIPLSICGSCGISTTSEPAIVTTPRMPAMPACPQMVIRPVMQMGMGCPSACP